MTDVAGLQREASNIHPGTVARLLDWWGRERRELPWRAEPGTVPDPYRVWLSEIMLQQTTVKAVIPFFERFTARWPTVGALAAAGEEDVLSEWAGLGYYSRARNLLRCARAVVEEHGGLFPRTEAELRILPGIGRYTAAAIAAIAFGQAAAPVDGNIERVVARLFAVRQPLPGARAGIRRLAASLAPRSRAGDFAQALMDLGAAICTPRRPSCLMCPMASGCRARAMGLAAELPRRTARAERPARHGIAFVALREDGAVLLRQRPEEGLLARMLEVPSTEWLSEWPAPDDALSTPPVRADWWPVPGTVVHTFTHFRLELLVYRAVVPLDAALTFWAEPQRCRWLPRRDLDRAALPSLMRKIIAHGLKEQ